MLTAVASASATPPVDLNDTFVTDQSDVLSPAEESQANKRLAAASEETGIDLFVVFVDDFTDPSDRIEWADATAIQNGLGDSQYLLAVSTDGRQFFISASNDGPLRDSQITSIENKILPELRDNDWLGAVTVAAEQVESEKGAAGRTTAAVVGTIAGGGAVAGAGYGIWRASKKRRTKRETEEELQELRRTAGSALVAADDDVKAGQQELEFARAQFGDAPTRELAAALETAGTELSEAFALQQKLDDGVPDTEEDTRAWLTRIIELCTGIDASLEAQSKSLQDLRDIEKDTPRALAELQARSAESEQAGPAAEAELARLRGIYSEEALAGVAQAPEQAAGLVRFAQERGGIAQAAVTEGRNGDAAIAIHEAQIALIQAGDLQKALLAIGTDLGNVEARAAELITDMQNDVQQGRAMPDPDGRIAPAIQETESQLARAAADLGGTGRNPARAVQALEAANAAIDGVLETARATERARQLLDARLARASESVSTAEQFIASYRGGIGPTARTRVSEARAALARAEGSRQTDPNGALRDLDRAEQLANEALSTAQSEMSNWNSGYGGGGYGGGGYGGGGYGGRSSGDDLSAILGGILGGSISSGWGGGGSWGGGRSSGGSSWGGGRSSGGRSSGGGGRRSGGGGGGRRSSGGGRF